MHVIFSETLILLLMVLVLFYWKRMIDRFEKDLKEFQDWWEEQDKECGCCQQCQPDQAEK